MFKDLLEKTISKTLTQSIPLLISLLYYMIEIYHYICYDMYNYLKLNDNVSYETNFWENIEDIDDYFNSKIMMGVDKIVNLKVIKQ